MAGLDGFTGCGLLLIECGGQVEFGWSLLKLAG